MGPSSTPRLALKDVCDVIVEHLTNIINSFISDKTYPNNLETVNVTPLFKKDHPDNPQNRKPI